MDATILLMFSAVGFVIFMIVLMGFMRVVIRVGQIEGHAAQMLKELRYIRHLDEIKAGVPSADSPQ